MSAAATSPAGAPQIDEAKLHAFVGKMVGDVGATLTGALVVIGDRLGLYRALAARRDDVRSARRGDRNHERYVREWLANQAASGYLSYDPRSEDVHPAGGTPAAARRRDEPRAALRPVPDRADAVRRRAADHRSVQDRPRFRLARARRAAVRRDGTLLPPRLQRQPRVDLDPGARRRRGEAARRRARRRRRLRFRHVDDRDGEGVSAVAIRGLRLPRRLDRSPRARRPRGPASTDRVRFEVASAKKFPGKGYDFIACFDCIHDMGDPVGALAHIREALRRTARS